MRENGDFGVTPGRRRKGDSDTREQKAKITECSYSARRGWECWESGAAQSTVGESNGESGHVSSQDPTRES